MAHQHFILIWFNLINSSTSLFFFNLNYRDTWLILGCQNRNIDSSQNECPYLIYVIFPKWLCLLELVEEEKTSLYPQGSFGWSNNHINVIHISKRKWPNLIRQICMISSNTWKSQETWCTWQVQRQKGKIRCI